MPDRAESEEILVDAVRPSSPATERDTSSPPHAPNRSPPQRMPSRRGVNLANRVVMLLSDPLQYKIGNQFLSADETQKLELDWEADKLRQALSDGATDYNVDVELQVRIATVDALQSAVTLGARVIHFSGHSMMFEDGRGSAKQLEPERLRLLVSAGGAAACRLVVVNSCQSEAAGRAFVAAGVEHVVAVAQNQNNGRISDCAARAFCRSFYLSLVSGLQVRRAFEVGCASAHEKMEGPLASQRPFVLLPEDKPHDEPIFERIEGTFRETTPLPVPSNALGPPTFYVGRAYDQLKCVTSILRYRITTIGGLYGSGKSALAASAAVYAARRRKFYAVVWVEARTQERFFDDVIEAAEKVIGKMERDALSEVSPNASRPVLGRWGSTLTSEVSPNAGGRGSRTWSLDDDKTVEDVGLGLDTSALADLASMGRVLVVLNDFERLVVSGSHPERWRSVPSQQLEARARCRRLLSALLKCGGASCSSNIRVLMTCSSGSGIGLVPDVTENVITLGPLTPDKTALMLLYRARELLHRATDPNDPLAPEIAPHYLVTKCALHPLMKLLNGLPSAVMLAVRIVNKLFAEEAAAKAACEAAGACKTPPPQSLEPLDRVLRVLETAALEDPDLQQLRGELKYVVQFGRGYRPEPKPEEVGFTASVSQSGSCIASTSPGRWALRRRLGAPGPSTRWNSLRSWFRSTSPSEPAPSRSASPCDCCLSWFGSTSAGVGSLGLSGPPGLDDRLEKLASLRERGALTDAEFAKAKALQLGL